MDEATVVLVDTLPIVLLGFRNLLTVESGCCIVGEATNGLNAVELADKLKPHLLVIELTLPGLNGIDAARQISVRSPSTRVLLLTSDSSESLLLESLKSGVYGFISKDAATSELLHACRELACGRRYLGKSITDMPVDYFLEKARSYSPVAYDTLTIREKEVLQLASEGYKSAEIARRLCISARTAEAHRSHLMRKLDLHNQTSLIRFVMRRGTLSDYSEPT